MGFFSWKTQDTDKSIANSYSQRPTFKVHMHDNKGNVWAEDEYEGYGEFGGKDFYELLAEMNGLTTREEGIDLKYSGNPYLSPNITETDKWEYVEDEPEDCEYQGYFYDDEDDDEDEEDEENED
jgi:hypothetical protein